MSLKYKDARDISHKPLLEVRARLESLNEQKQEVDRQREKLRIEALNLHGALQLAEKDLMEEIEIYSNAWGHSFGAMLLESLPREIRDLIYAKLVVFNSPVVISTAVNREFWGDWSLTRTKSSYDSRTKDIVDQCQPFVSSEFFGPAVSQEIMQTFYEKNLFHLPQMEELEGFLTTDVFSEGFLPSDWVRSLRVVVNDDMFFDAWGWGPPDISHNEPLIPISDPKREALFDHLDHLDLVKNKPSFELTLHIPTSSMRFVPHRLVYDIGTVVFRLRDQGFQVKVTYGRLNGQKKIKSMPSSDKVYPWPGKDLTFLFDGDREDWYRKAEEKKLYTELPEDSE